MSTLPQPEPRSARAETVNISRRQTALLVLLIVVPVPLLTLGGLAVPFPELVQRALAPLLPFVETPGSPDAASTPAVAAVPILGAAAADDTVVQAPVRPAARQPQRVAPSRASAVVASVPVPSGSPPEVREPVDDAEPATGGAATPPETPPASGGDSGTEGSSPAPPPPPPPAPPSPPPPPPPAPPAPPPPPPPAPPPPPPPAPPPPPPPAPPPPIAGVVPDPGQLLEDPLGTLVETVNEILSPILKPKR